MNSVYLLRFDWIDAWVIHHPLSGHVFKVHWHLGSEISTHQLSHYFTWQKKPWSKDKEKINNIVDVKFIFDTNYKISKET